MIRLERGPEPASLASVRVAELVRVRAIASAGAVNSDAVGQAYSVVKRDLWLQQAMRCCYCEHQIVNDYNDVEHFRPKARADRQDGTIHPGYWWLAWTWKNLLFSCPSCNRSAKNDLFPLEPGSVPLLPEVHPPGTERPTLIDPYEEDPVELIQFVFDGAHWRPVGRNGSKRGERTIDILKLARADLLTLYDAHVKDHVQPRVEDARDAIAREDAAQLNRAWRRVRGLLAPRMPFVALTFDVVEQLVPADERRRWNLELPRPPVRGS